MNVVVAKAPPEMPNSTKRMDVLEPLVCAVTTIDPSSLVPEAAIVRPVNAL